MRATRAWNLFVGLLAVVVSMSCGPSEAKQRELYYYTKQYSFTITPSEAPPHAREDITYKVFIRDRDTRAPLQNGEGQIYSSNREGAKTWDGLTYGPEVGTYHGKLNFVTSGLWAVAIRFRSDSLHPLEKVEWMQDVLNERPGGTP